MNNHINDFASTVKQKSVFGAMLAKKALDSPFVISYCEFICFCGKCLILFRLKANKKFNQRKDRAKRDIFLRKLIKLLKIKEL